MANPLAYVVATTSTLFRVGVYIFLRVIPSTLLKTILPSLYVVYLSSNWLYESTLRGPSPPDPKSQVVSEGNGVIIEHQPQKALVRRITYLFPDPWNSSFPIQWHRLSRNLVGLVLSFPSCRRDIRIFNTILNTILLMAATEFVLFPVYDDASGVVFTRVGAVYPDAAKIAVRYPAQNATEHVIHLTWRPIRVEELPWTNGPDIRLSAEDDWINTVYLGGLWPDTPYEYTFKSVEGEELTHPFQSRRFKTFPDPRLQTTSHFRFLVSSCVTPNFPYLPFYGRRIKGFDLLADYLSQPSVREPATNHERTPSQNGSSEADDNSTESSTIQDPLFVAPSTEFMLFLGDFIYADVPVFFGDNQEAFRRLYRRNYQSQSFRKIYEQLPIFHTYDDHEIINNFAGQGIDTPPYANASNAYKLYNADANYDSFHGNGSYYYDFRYADVAFFVMDTRRYRSAVHNEDVASRTMLGEEQLTGLYKWLTEVNNTATFKFVVTSVPFTSLWQHDARWDSWAAYPFEKAALLNAMHSVPNVILLSGDRHEFAAVKFTSERNASDILEISTSPLSMFYIPFVRTLRMQSDEIALRVRESGPPEEIPREQVLKYLPLGNHKWSSIEVDTRDPEHPTVHLEVVVDGTPSYRLSVQGRPVGTKGSTAVGGLVATNLKDILGRIGLKPSLWF